MDAQLCCLGQPQIRTDWAFKTYRFVNFVNTVTLMTWANGCEKWQIRSILYSIDRPWARGPWAHLRPCSAGLTRGTGRKEDAGFTDAWNQESRLQLIGGRTQVVVFWLASENITQKQSGKSGAIYHCLYVWRGWSEMVRLGLPGKAKIYFVACKGR